MPIRRLLARLFVCLIALASCGESALRAQNVIDVQVAPAQVPAQAVAPAPAINPADPEKAAAEDPQLAALRAQYEPMLRVELSFANRACQWTQQQRKDAIATANAWLREFVRDDAKNNRGGPRGLMIVQGNAVAARVARGAGDGRIEKKLEDKLRDAMTDQQRAVYEAERKKRDAFRAEATIDNIIAQMDRVLNLTVEQRGKIHDSLRENWSDDWTPPLELFVQMNEYAPAFPDEFVTPHLTAAQRAVWQGVQRISARGILFGQGPFGGQAVTIDDVDLHEGQ